MKAVDTDPDISYDWIVFACIYDDDFLSGDNEALWTVGTEEWEFDWKALNSSIFWCARNSEETIEFSCSLRRFRDRLISIFVSLKRWRRETMFWNSKSKLKLQTQACILFSIPHDEMKDAEGNKAVKCWSYIYIDVSKN